MIYTSNNSKSIVLQQQNIFYWCLRLQNKKYIPLPYNLNQYKTTIILPIAGPVFKTLNLNVLGNRHQKITNIDVNAASNKYFSKYLRTVCLWNFKKIKYHGKGYKIRKNNKFKKLTCRFGRSHWTKVIFNNRLLVIRRTKKNTFTFISLNSKIFNQLRSIVLAIKGVSKYTKRGIRLTRQPLKRRYGKVSQANSVYK